MNKKIILLIAAIVLIITLVAAFIILKNSSVNSMEPTAPVADQQVPDETKAVAESVSESESNEEVSTELPNEETVNSVTLPSKPEQMEEGDTKPEAVTPDPFEDSTNGDETVMPSAPESDNSDQNTTPEETKPSVPENTDPAPDKPEQIHVTYEAYQAMSGQEQMDFYHSFEDPNEFFAWYHHAEEIYESNRNVTILDGSGEIVIKP